MRRPWQSKAVRCTLVVGVGEHGGPELMEFGNGCPYEMR